jgi:branched-subunit amino acid permease
MSIAYYFMALVVAALLCFIAWAAVGIDDPVGAVALIALIVVVGIIAVKFIVPTIGEIQSKRAKQRREPRGKSDG